MILILLFVALSIVAALFAGLLGLLGGAEFDLSSIVGAAILVGGAIVMVMAAILSRPA